MSTDQAIHVGELMAEVERLRAFVREWSNRFGFMATANEPDSFDSIDEVAVVINAEKDRLRAKVAELEGHLRCPDLSTGEIAYVTALDKARAEMRERCAQIADADTSCQYDGAAYKFGAESARRNIAAAIRGSK